MAGDFDGRMDELMNAVGFGFVVGRVEYDQAYAHRQHEEIGWKHPEGGKAMYLTDPLNELWPTFMERIASRALEHDGVVSAMVENMQQLAEVSAGQAPERMGILKGSVHPSVEDHGMVVWDVPPEVPRLTDEQLDALHLEWYHLTHPGSKRRR